MAVRAQFELKGMKALTDDFKKMSYKMQNVVAKRALNTAGSFLSKRIKAKLPTKNDKKGFTGNLRKSVRYSVENKRYGLRLVMEAKAPHAHLVEFGHNIVARGTRRKPNKGGKVRGRVPAYPFMAPTFDENYRGMLRIVETIMAKGAELGG